LGQQRRSAVKEAQALYVNLCKREWVPTEKSPAIESFYQDLCQMYPEIDTLPEEKRDSCPWSCAHDKSGSHLIICMCYGNTLEETIESVLRLANKHGLICYNPQGPHVYIPVQLQRDRFQVSSIRVGFDSAVNDFIRFVVEQGYPPTLLWTTQQDVVLWRRRFFVRWSDPVERSQQAEEDFENGLARGFGVALDGRGKVDSITISRVFVPEDDLDAQYRQIPLTGFKMSVAVDPRPFVLVKTVALWWLLEQVGSSAQSAWD